MTYKIKNKKEAKKVMNAYAKSRGIKIIWKK